MQLRASIVPLANGSRLRSDFVREIPDDWSRCREGARAGSARTTSRSRLAVSSTRRCSTAKGGIECDLTVYRIWTKIAFTSSRARDSQHTTSTGFRARFPPGLEAQLIDVTSATVCSRSWDPNARKVLEKVTRDDVSNAGFPLRPGKRIDNCRCIGARIARDLCRRAWLGDPRAGRSRDRASTGR